MESWHFFLGEKQGHSFLPGLLGKIKKLSDEKPAIYEVPSWPNDEGGCEIRNGYSQPKTLGHEQGSLVVAREGLRGA